LGLHWLVLLTDGDFRKRYPGDKAAWIGELDDLDEFLGILSMALYAPGAGSLWYYYKEWKTERNP
jgi:hypothetical protein